jgi:signal transduction histidine kinase
VNSYAELRRSPHRAHGYARRGPARSPAPVNAELAACVAHDIGNALTAVRGYGELLLRELGGDDSAHALAAELLAAAGRAAELAGGLLPAVRPEPARRQRIDVNDVLARAEGIVRGMLPAGIELQVRRPRAPVRVDADPARLADALVNLAVNACHAMPDGGRLEIRACGRSGRALLEVTDTGAGMSPAVAARALQPFFTTRPAGQGSGLGLASVVRSVEEARGRVEIDSRERQGTTVTIELPEARDDR